MQLKRVALLTLAVSTLLGQQWTIANIRVRGEPPLRHATCKHSAYGYLHIAERTKLTPSEIGQYVAASIDSGTTLAVYPESKSGIFVYAACPNQP
jgi:hypothetical protein